MPSLECFSASIGVRLKDELVRLPEDVVTLGVSHDHDNARINGGDCNEESGRTPCVKDGFGELQENKNIRYSFICPNKSLVPPLYITLRIPLFVLCKCCRST